MKIALVQPVQLAAGRAFGWKWRSEDDTTASAGTFRYFHDCCENARRKGYQTRFDAAGAEGGTSASHEAAVQAAQVRA